MLDIFLNKPKIQSYLTQVLDTNTEDTWQKDVNTRLATFLSGGKMIRGCLADFTCRILKKNQSIDPLPLAAAIELIQAAFLIHDDIMDQDELRRGAPSIYVQYQQHAKNHHYQEAKKTGESLAICAGDAAIFLAYEQLGKLNLSSETYTRLFKFISQEWQKTCWGQMQDIALSTQTEPATPEEILDMYRAKTISYTFCVPLVSAAIVHEQPKTVIQLLDRLGEAAGLLFQLHDDELNLYGDQKITGKPVGSDQRENKQTYWRAVNFDKLKVHGLMDKLQSDAEMLIGQLPVADQAQNTLRELVSFVRNRPK